MKVLKGNLKLEPFGNFVKNGYRVVYENTKVIEPEIAMQNNFPVFLQATDVATPFINTDSLSYVDESDWIRYPKGRIKRGEILIEVKGKIEKVAIVPDDFTKKTLVSGSLYKMTVNERINKYFLLVYLITKFGQAFKERAKTNLLVSFVSKHDLFKIPVPIFSDNLQTQIENLVKQAHAKLEESKALYAEAENLLLAELGLRDWSEPSAVADGLTPQSELSNDNLQPPATAGGSDKVNYSVKSFRESFLATGRLDAEYYHPEKQRMLDWLGKFAGKSVGFYFSSINALIDPTKGFSSEPVCNYDLTDALEIYLDAREPIPSYELGSSKKMMKRGDVVVSRLRSYLKEIAIVDTPEDANIVGSSEFIVLRLNDEAVNAETLLVYLRSLPVQQILKWCQSGSNHPRFMEEDLLSLKLPDKVVELQNTFQTYVRKSIDLNHESKHLLETAKRAVEIAIEQDENAALAMIEGEMPMVIG